MAGKTMAQQAVAERWSTETLGHTIRVVDDEGSDVVFIGGVEAEGVRPLADFIASAPTMRAKLTATAGSLAEIDAALGLTFERLSQGDVGAALLGLRHIQEAVQALRAAVEEV